MEQILRYFVRNPDAADSLEGITRWRLLEEQIHHRLRETQVALSWLVQQGLIQEVSTLGTEPIFCLNLKRRADAISFLQGKLQTPKD